MREALPPEQPPTAMPEGVVRLRIDGATGQRVPGAPKGSIFEYFLEEFQPKDSGLEDSPLGTDELEGLF